MTYQNKGFVESISYLPSWLEGRKAKTGIVRSVSEGGGARQLFPGDCVAGNEKIITDKGLCVVIEYPMETGTVLRVFM